MDTAVAVIEKEIGSVTGQAAAFAITDTASMDAAGKFLQSSVKAVLKRADAAFDPIIAAAHEAHKVAVAQKKTVTAPLLAAEATIKRAIADYHGKMVAAAEAERRRLEAEARERAEAQRLEAALALEKAGKTAAAETLIQAPVVVEPPRVARPIAAPAGVSVKKVWKFRIVNPQAVNIAYLMPNERAIGDAVKALGASAPATVGAGVEVFEESIVSSRSF